MLNFSGLSLRLTGLVGGNAEISRFDIFHDFDAVVVLVVLASSFSGLAIGYLMKFTDNVVIIFADSLSLLISIVLSYLFFGLLFGYAFIAGVLLIIGSSYLYNQEGSGDERRRRKRGGGEDYRGLRQDESVGDEGVGDEDEHERDDGDDNEGGGVGVGGAGGGGAGGARVDFIL